VDVNAIQHEDKEDEITYCTKVVTQFVQFLSDNRAADTLIEEASVMDEENLEPTKLA